MLGDAYIRRPHTHAYTWATHIYVARSQWVKKKKTGLFTWIRPTALSRTYFITQANQILTIILILKEYYITIKL